MKKLIYIFILTASFISCSSKNNASNKFKSTILESEVFPKNFTVAEHNNKLNYIFSDERMLSIKKSSIGSKDKESKLIDSIDTDEKLNILFGRHNYFIDKNGKEYLFFIDVQTEKKKLFKILTKEENLTNYTLILPRINASLFDVINDGEIFYILSKGEENIEIYTFTNGEISDPEIIDIKSEKTKDFKFFYINETFKIIYTTDDGDLYINNYLAVDASFIESKKIDFNVSEFKSVHDNHTHIVYNKTDYSLNYYRESEKLTFGYFANLFNYDFITINNSPVLFISTYTKRSKDKKQYPISAIFKNNKKWHEENIIYGEVPATALNAYLFKDKVYILSGIGNITLTTTGKSTFY